MVACPMRVIVIALLLVSAGCAIRLSAPIPMAPQQLRLITTARQKDYVLHVEGVRPRDYQIPVDGRVKFDAPSGMPRGCTLYFLGVIKIGDGADPSKPKVIDLIAGGRTLRKLSMGEIFSLPADADGYHLLNLSR
jgi:hypothetical protein